MPILKIPIPKGRLGVKLADGPDTADTVVIDNILDDSVMKGKLFVDDVILSAGGIEVSSIDELVPLVKNLEGDDRYFMVKREKSEEDEESSEEETVDFDPNLIVLDEHTGLENVKLPAGPSLGIRLDRKHKVLEIVPGSLVKDTVFVDDRIITLNGTNVEGMTTKEFVKFLKKQNQANRVLGIKRAPHSPRQVPVPPVETIGLVLRDNDGGWIDCLELYDSSPLKGKVFPGDRVVGANCRKLRKLKTLVPMMKDKKHRVLTVVTPGSSTSERTERSIKKSPQKNLISAARLHRTSLKAKSVSDESATITSYKTVGEEIFVNVIAPKGKLGLKLGKNHEVKDLLSTSPLAGKIFKDDRIVSIDEVDIRGRNASSLAVLLMATQHRARAIGIRRKTGNTIRIAMQETRKSAMADAYLEELEERFPSLCQFDVPLGDGATDTSTRCKILSELLALHETLGLANDVETENGSFCHVIKIPKKGLNRRGELMSTLDDLMASLDSICGTETDATDLLLEFLAKRSPSSYLKHRKIAESRPTKRRKIEESKVEPHENGDSRKRTRIESENGSKDEENKTGGKDGGVDLLRKAEKNAGSGSDGVKDSNARETNSNALENTTGASVPNPLADASSNSSAEKSSATGEAVLNATVPSNGRITESSGESDSLAKAAAANLLAPVDTDSHSNDVEMVDAATTDPTNPDGSSR